MPAKPGGRSAVNEKQPITMPTLLVSYILPEPSLRSLANHFELIYPTDTQAFSDEEIAQHIVRADAYLAVNTAVDRSLIDRAERLKIIANYGAGYDDIDTAYAADRGIPVTNTPTAVTEATAEIALGLMLSLLRNITFCDRQLRHNQDFVWGMLKTHTGRTLYGKTLGLVGLGRIGQAVARRAVVSGMRVIYHQRHALFTTLERNLGAQYRSLEDLLAEADVVSLHVPLTDSTHHLLGEAELNRMKPSAYLINTARGGVVDQKALVRHLQAGKLAGAGLDVFADEPQIPSELLTLDNVVLTPHIGTEAIEARIAMAAEAERNLVAFFREEALPNQVN